MKEKKVSVSAKEISAPILELDISNWGKPVHQTQYFNLENWKNQVQIDRGTVSPNYFQSIKINIGPSDIGRIVPSTHRPSILYQRLLDLWPVY